MSTDPTPRRLLVPFLTVTFAFSWGLFAIAHLLHATDEAAVARVVLPYGLGPLAGALFVQWRRNEPANSLLGGDPFPSRWWLVAWALGPALAVGAMLLAPAFPGVELTTDLVRKLEAMRAATTQQPTPEQWAEVLKNYQGVSAGLFVAANFAPAILYGATVGAAVGLGEEIGWRVTMLRGLAGLGFWRAAMVAGLVRGVWAVPLALVGFPYPAHPHHGAGLVIVYSLLVGVVATYLRTRGANVLAAAVFVGSVTTGAQVSDLLLLGGSDLNTRTTGYPGLILLAIVVLLLVVPGTKAANAAWAKVTSLHTGGDLKTPGGAGASR